MKTHNQHTGAKGEELAAAYLEKNGYIILNKNIKAAKAEIDILAKFNHILVFVEVKTRNNNFFGYPEESVGMKKEENIARAAAIIIEELNHEEEIRFDIISITLNPTVEIHHIEDAFFPGL